MPPKDLGGRNQHTVRGTVRQVFLPSDSFLLTQIGQKDGERILPSPPPKKKKKKKKNQFPKPILPEAGRCLSGFHIYSDYSDYFEDQFPLIPTIAFFFHI